EGRRFVQKIRPRVTTAVPWDTVASKPPITLNIGFSFHGLRALDLPTRTLRLLPDEFIDGMGRRADILGDVGNSAPDKWNPIWRHPGISPVHIWVSLNVAMAAVGSALPILDDWTRWLEGLAEESGGGVGLLPGHGEDGSGRWQDSSA